MRTSLSSALSLNLSLSLSLSPSVRVISCCSRVAFPASRLTCLASYICMYHTRNRFFPAVFRRLLRCAQGAQEQQAVVQVQPKAGAPHVRGGRHGQAAENHQGAPEVSFVSHRTASYVSGGGTEEQATRVAQAQVAKADGEAMERDRRQPESKPCGRHHSPARSSSHLGAHLAYIYIGRTGSPPSPVVTRTGERENTRNIHIIMWYQSICRDDVMVWCLVLTFLSLLSLFWCFWGVLSLAGSFA